MVLNTFKSVAIGLVLGAGVAVATSICLTAPALLQGFATAKELGDALALLMPAGLFAGLTLGAIAPYVRSPRRVGLTIAAIAVYPVAAIFALSVFTMVKDAMMPPPSSALFVLLMSIAYLPYVALPAAGAVLLLERVTRRPV